MLTTIGRAATLAAIPILLLLNALDFWALAVVVLILGVLTLLSDSAEQPLLPRIVPRASLVTANSRIGQSRTVAGTAGPALGGVLFNIVGAPILFAFEAVINAIAAILQARINVDEPKPEKRPPERHAGHDIAEGMRYTSASDPAAARALGARVVPRQQSIVVTVFAVFVLRELALPSWAFGVALTAGGVGGFVGAMIAPRVGVRLGAGKAILLGC